MAEHEIELKLGVPADRLPALRRALARGTVRHERLHADYYDSEDERLGRHGIALRLRREGRHWVQTAKASTDDAARRLEDNVPIPGRSSRDAPALDPTRHAGTPVGAALQKALAGPAHGAATLVARYAIDVRRTTRTVRHAGTRIELALDLGHVSAAGREQAICELELELKAGDEGALYSLAERWLAAHGLWLCAESKAARGARLARGEAAAPPVKARAPQFDGEAPTAASALRAVTRSCLEQIVGNADALADGSDDVDHVHQMRVGLRRMRSALREMGDFGGALDSAWEPTLSQAFRELGAHRDRAVVLPRWATEMAQCAAPPLALPASTLPTRDLVSIARDPRLQRTLLSLLCFSATGAKADPADAPDDDAGDARQRFAQRLQDLHERIVRDAKRFSKLDGTQQHRVRKRLKRLRYLSEFAAPLFSGRAVGRYLGAMSGAQDELGTLNDERTAADAWRRDAERQPQAWFAVGWLAARQADGVRRSERALRLIAKAPRFWKKAVT